MDVDGNHCRESLPQDYYSFTLAQLQWDGWLPSSPMPQVSAFTFDIQAVDAQGNLSDSDETDSDFDPVSVSISVIALKEIDAGKKTRINDDGALTPDSTTLDAWTAAMVADSTLRIFVRLRHGKDGIVTMDEGVVAEGLSLGSHGVLDSSIVISWSADNQELSLQATASAVAADFRAILGALELQTVHFGAVSHRTIEVEAPGSVARATYYVREVEVSASPPNPFMKVDFGKERMMSKRRLMLNENHIEVVDPDTVLVDGSVDASNITLRVTNLSGGKLEKFSSNTWTEITSSPLEFTLEELRNGLVSFLADPSDDVSALTFDIQAVDPQGNLSDSDESDDDADPVSVSVPVIPLKEIDAGKKMRVNDDHALTPDDTTLGAWIAADNTLTIFVELKHGKRWSGARKVVQEQLFSKTHSIADSKIAISWDANNWRLVLEGSSIAAVGDFKAVLDALELQTVRFATASERTISVRPDLQVEVDKQDYYTRDVLVRASGSRPYVGVQEFSTLRFGDDDRAILLSSEFFVEDFDSSAADITIVMTELLAGATLQKSDNAGSYSDIIAPLEFTLAELQQGLIAIYMPGALGKKITFELKAKDDGSLWSDIGTSNTYVGGVRAFELEAVLGLSSEALEVDVQTGYQRAVPFGGLKGKIETVRGATSRDGALRITLENATPGDRLVMRKSVTGIAGAWSDRGHVYTLTVSDTISSEDIDTAVSEVYYRASEVAGEQVRRVLVHWVDNSGDPPTLLYEVSLYNRPPVLRNWGLGAMYHDITPAPGATEASLELGYHPYSEYMPEVLDNEGRVVRLEVVLVDKDGDVLSADERVFLSKLLREQAQAGGLVVRELRSSDRKARALVIEVADEKTFVSPAFMSRFLQGLEYRHGPSGGTLDLGERRRISVSVFDGQSHTRTHEMEVRLVDTLPNPARYVNTFIGTAKQSGMGVSQGTGNTDNEAGMTFPGAAYPFGAVRLTPQTGQSPAYGGYRDDKSLSSMKFVVTAFSGPGCKGAEAGESTGGFSVGVGSSETKNADKSSQESEAGYYEVLLRGGGNEVLFEAAASSPRTSTMRLTYQNDAATGFVRLPGSVTLSEQDGHWVVTYNTSEEGICSPTDTSVDSGLFVSMHIGKHQVSTVTKSGNDIQFELKSGHRAVDIKLSISYVSREGASRNIDVENPGWPAFEVQKEKAGKAWNYYLSKVAIDKFQDDDHDKTEQLDKWSIFYSALYRSLLHMNTASDVDGNYKGIGDHNKNVKDAPSYGYDADPGTEGSGLKVYFTNFSGWDVYRSQMSLVGLVAPALSQDMAISLLESAYVDGTANYPQGDREIPRSTTGYHETSAKFGDPGPPSVSSLFMFGSQSVSLHGMLEVFDKSRTARVPGEEDAHHILEGVASDAAIAQMALWMSQQDSFPEALREKARSLYENARARTDRALNLLDTSGYSKRSRSSIADDKESHYTQFSEGNSIQYTFMNTHNVLGLKQKIDDGEAALPLLTRLLISQPALGGSSAYSTLLGLSKTEGLARWDAPNNERSMAIRFLTHFLKPNEGQGSWYAFMGNEVGHSSPFLANWFEPHLTQNAARRISLFGFRNAAGGLYGNDDLGATSAWYVWTAMGLYPVIPGVGGVTLVAPRFAHVEISVPGGKSVELRSSSASGEDAYIQSLERDGRKTSSLWLTASELLRGVELDFQVGASKSSWGEDTPDAPPSYGDTESDLLAGSSYSSIWRDEGDDATGASSHSAFDGDHNTAWRFVSESDGSKVLEVDFTSVYAANGLLLRHADVGRTSTLNSDLSNVTVSVEVKNADGDWIPVTLVNVAARDYDTRRMLLTFDAEAEMYGLRLTFAGLDANEEHGIYEVLAKDGSVKEAARLRSRRSLLETTLDDDVTWVSKADAEPRPLLFVDGLKGTLKVNVDRYLVLSEHDFWVDDADTRVPETGDVDASKIKFRVRNVVGGELHERTLKTWTKIPDTNGYQEFSLADLRAGKIGFKGGDGTSNITFTIQAMDDQGNLSDSDPTTANIMEPADGEILVFPPMKSTAGYGALINADGGLMPDTKTLNVWMEVAQEHGTTLHVIVKVLSREAGDVLSLKGGSYDASKIRPVWDKTKWELSLEILAGATAEDIQAALRALWLETELSDVASTRNIAVFPTLPGLRLSGTSKYLRYRVDETRGLVRYHLHDRTLRTAPAALAAAAERSLFGKKGYMAFPTSAGGLLVYRGIADSQSGRLSTVHAGLSDEDTEGQWVIMDGPRQGQVFWDHSTTSYGPGAEGSGLRVKNDLWYVPSSQTRYPRTDTRYNYARMSSSGLLRDVRGTDQFPSITSFDLWLSDGEFFLRSLDVGESPPSPLLHIDLGKARVDPGQRLVLTENHILVKDVDTILNDGTVDASKITLRVSGVSGGTLQSRASASADWGDMTKAEVNGVLKDYYAFTLAELRAGKVSFLAGDGLASGNGEKIVFRIQAADAGDPATPGSPSNLSDSDPTTSDLDPVDVEISIVPSVEVSSGFSGLVNEDGMLTPSPAKLDAWIESAGSDTLHIVVRLGNKQDGDILSLQTGYDASKIKTLNWDAKERELDIEFARGTTASEITTALNLLELTTKFSVSDSTRKIWLFPTLVGGSKFAYHFDESEGLARYYLFNDDWLTTSEAFKEASERIFFDVHGYMGVPTSTPEIRIYTAFGALADDDIYLAVTDSATEGKWLITAGPRKGQLFWDHTADPKEYGPGVRGSGWSAQDDFWASGHPADSRSQQEDIVMMYEGNVFAISVDSSRASVVVHDLWAQEGGMFSRVVEVKVSSSSPILEVDFSKFQATSQRPLILTEDHISVDDPDTRVQGNVDASKITLRVSDVVDGTLKKRISLSDGWVDMTEVSIGGAPQGYYAFTLADLQGGLIAFFPDPGVSTLAFTIQAADDGDGTPGSTPNLSDSDPYDGENDPDPITVSIPVVVLKEIEAGQKVALNDDESSRRIEIRWTRGSLQTTR